MQPSSSMRNLAEAQLIEELRGPTSAVTYRYLLRQSGFTLRIFEKLVAEREAKLLLEAELHHPRHEEM